MVLYNITLNIDNDITEACLDYLKRFYVPQATQSGVMHSPKIHKVLPYDDGDAQLCHPVQCEECGHVELLD